MDESRVRMAAKIYEMRDTARFLFGDEYEKKMEPYRAVIRQAAAKSGKSALMVVPVIVRRLEESGPTNPYVTIFLTAAAVDVTEADGRERIVADLLDDVLPRKERRRG